MTLTKDIRADLSLMIFDAFFRRARILQFEPMLVIVPVNGYYYDYTGFPKEAREKNTMRKSAKLQKSTV